MISAVAFCPHPPVLLEPVAGAAAAELADLRAACAAALDSVLAPGRDLALLGAGTVSRVHGPRACGSLLGYGVDLAVGTDEPAVLPLSLTIGRFLSGARPAPAYEVGPDWTGSAAAQALSEHAEQHDLAVLVMGDGSACRSIAAPGYLDERAEGFDAAVAAALAAGDPTALHLDPAGIGPELWCRSVPVWAVVAHLTAEARWDAHLAYDRAPYGVGYFVAHWRRAG